MIPGPAGIGEEPSLRRTVRDLAALAALPSLWISADIESGLQNLADILRAALRAKLLYIRVTPRTGAPLETTARDTIRADGRDAPAVGRRLAEQLDLDSPNATGALEGFDGFGPLNGFVQHVSLGGKLCGVLVACSDQPVFPDDHERLLLATGASQVAILLQRHEVDLDRVAVTTHAAALAQLSHELSLLDHEHAMIRTTAAIVGRHLRAQRCYVAHYDYRSEPPRVTVLDDWCRDPGRASLRGTYEALDFLRSEMDDGAAAGRVAIEDVARDPRLTTAREPYERLGIRAVASAGFLRQGRRIASLAVAEPAARDWTADELAFLEDAVARVWPLIERARTSEALRRSEESFRMIADNIAAFAWTADRDGARTWFNRRFYDYTGKTFEDLKGWGWEKIHHPDHFPRVKAGLQRCLELGKPWEDTFPLRGADGTYRWFLVRAMPIRDEHGVVLRWFGSNTDITELREAQEQLRQRTSTLEVLNRAGSMLSAEHDVEKIVQGVTDAARELTGAAFGAFFYNVMNERGESYMLYTLSGAPRDAFANFPMPRNTPLFGPTFRGEGVIRIGDVRSDPRFGRIPPHHGMPAGHLPVRSYLAVPVKSRSGAVLGGLFFGHPEPNVFTPEGESALISLAAQAAIAIDNANLYRDVQRQLAEHRRTEQALRESDARLQAILDNSATVIFLKDTGGRYLLVNEQFERLFHVTKEQAIGKTDADLFPADVAERFQANDRAVIEGRTGLEFEEIAPHGDGPHTYISIKFPLRREDGTIYAVGGIATDITARKRTALQQQALYELAARVNRAVDLTEIYDAALEAVCRCQGATRTAVLLLAEDRVMRFKASRGLSAEYQRAVEGHSPWKPDEPNPHPIWINDVDTAQLDESLRAVVKREGIGSLAFLPVTYERRLLGKFMVYYDAPHAFSRDELRPVEAIASQLAFAIERQRSADALDALVNARTASLRQAIEQMEEFSYSVSHDLRAPVRAMRCYAEAILQDYGRQLDPEGTAMLTRIHHNSGRMDRLISDLLTYSRISRRELQFEPVALERLIREILLQYPELQGPRVTIELCCPLPTVLAHEPSLQQVLSNLLANAVKFVAPGTHPHVRVRGERSEGGVRVWVEDNGIGIKPQFQARVFQMFERIHPDASYDGTGIGLAIVRKAVERMNGRVGLVSDGASGCRFWFELPPAPSG